jgi:hypothetical protein
MHAITICINRMVLSVCHFTIGEPRAHRGVASRTAIETFPQCVQRTALTHGEMSLSDVQALVNAQQADCSRPPQSCRRSAPEPWITISATWIKTCRRRKGAPAPPAFCAAPEDSQGRPLMTFADGALAVFTSTACAFWLTSRRSRRRSRIRAVRRQSRLARGSCFSPRTHPRWRMRSRTRAIGKWLSCF